MAERPTAPPRADRRGSARPSRPSRCPTRHWISAAIPTGAGRVVRRSAARGPTTGTCALPSDTPHRRAALHTLFQRSWRCSSIVSGALIASAAHVRQPGAVDHFMGLPDLPRHSVSWSLGPAGHHLQLRQRQPSWTCRRLRNTFLSPCWAWASTDRLHSRIVRRHPGGEMRRSIEGPGQARDDPPTCCPRRCASSSADGRQFISLLRPPRWSSRCPTAELYGAPPSCNGCSCSADAARRRHRYLVITSILMVASISWRSTSPGRRAISPPASSRPCRRRAYPNEHPRRGSRARPPGVGDGPITPDPPTAPPGAPHGRGPACSSPGRLRCSRASTCGPRGTVTASSAPGSGSRRCCAASITWSRSAPVACTSTAS